MAASDVAFFDATNKGLRVKAKWLVDATAAAVANRRRLKGILGVKEEDILQVNVIALYSLGTVKKNVQTAFAQSLASLQGIIIVFYPISCKY